LKQRRVRFTQTAQRHVRREKLWWLENRDYPEIFADELEQAARLLAVLPGPARSTRRRTFLVFAESI
jgi:hypothetical protein